MTNPKHFQIYFFSGTGNSKKVVQWISETVTERKNNATSIDINNINRVNSDKPHADSTLFFISPIHGFNYPPVMMHFIMRFPKGKNKVVLMNTRAGMRIGNWVTPGLTGIAFYFAALILLIKGYKIQAMRPVDMPSNWISVHPGLNKKAIRFLHFKNRSRVKKFTTCIIDGKNSYKPLIELVQDLAIAPISILYYLYGRFVLAKMYFASNDCNNCGLCIKNCPVKAIKLVSNRPFWTHHCESCMKCVGDCPKKAIEAAHGSIAVVSVLFSSVVMVAFYKYFEMLFFELNNLIMQFIVKWGIFFLLLLAWYRLTHFLLRFKFFEKLMVYTSLTKYKFWGRRYKALKDNDY